MDKDTLDDEELGVIVDQKAAEAVGWYNSKLSTERERVINYYNGELPKRTSQGSSSYISTDVYDAVESMKAQLLETFAAGQQIVKFDPLTANDVEDAKIGSGYANHVLFVDNNGYSNFSEIIDDGLKARVGIMKVFWHEDFEYIDETFEDASEDEARAFAASEDVHALEATETIPGSGRFSGKRTRKIDKSQIRMEVVNPEEFSVESHAKKLDRHTFCVQQSLKTRDELIKLGYDRDKVMEYNADDDLALQANPEVLARFQAIDSGVTADSSPANERTHRVMVTEAYIECLRDGDDHAKLYKVVRLGHETLESPEVEDLPYLPFVPLPIPHSFYGNNFAARVIPAQNARTALMRSILDHTAITTNPRMTVLKGGVTNPKELLDNRLGGVVNITRPDAVQPLQQASLNPFVFQTLELVKSNTEETTGMSALSQGLNKDAISSQNSDAMVERLVSLSQTRQKIIARNFAINFLAPLFTKIYNIALVKQKRKRIVEVVGEWHEVDVTKWKQGRSASASLHLGYGEQARRATTLIGAGHMIAADPQLDSLWQLPGRYQMACDVFHLQGIYNVHDYLTPPDKMPPPKPQGPTPEQQVEMLKAQAAQTTAKANSDKVTMHGQIESAREQLAQEQLKVTNSLKERAEERKDSETANKIDIAQREMAMVEKTPISTETASVAPH